MRAAPDIEVAADPLCYGEPFSLERTFHPMGFPVRLSTNNPDVMEAASHIWNAFEPLYGVRPLRVRFAVSGTTSTRAVPPPLPYGQEHLISVVHSAADFALADLVQGLIWGRITASTAADHEYFRYHFLEPLVYLTLGSLYLAPVHAACASLDGRGLLLCGDSGAGKTSLAYFLARRGWTYVSDDATHLVRGNGGRRVVGRPHHIRFRSSAREVFPELSACPGVTRANGKVDLVLSTGDLGLESVSPTADAVYLIFLRRQAGQPARLDPFDRTEARAAFEQVLCFGTESARIEMRAEIDDLVTLPVFRLFYSGFDEAERLLRTLVRG